MLVPSLGSVLLARWRKNLGISQSAAAERIGVAQPTWCSYEKGGTIPGTGKAVEIEAETFGAVPVTAWTKPAPIDDPATPESTDPANPPGAAA